ncbi:MAG: hypothetical protein JSS35_20165 [Proteobacteria bacterium]|nr:hypothetical protein [Pseudomonadota bacterium]
MFRIRVLDLALGALAAAALSPMAVAAAQKPPPAPGYGQDLISVVRPQEGIFPTGECIVWANAEGLGVGRQQLDGYHGVTLDLDLKPVGHDGDRPTSFADALAGARKRFPDAPAWMFKTLEDNRPAIEAACAEDHDTPFVVHKVTAADKKE